jgi:hypothetical protein
MRLFSDCGVRPAERMVYSTLSVEDVEAHRGGAEDAEEAPRKTMLKSLRPLCELCASAMNATCLKLKDESRRGDL